MFTTYDPQRMNGYNYANNNSVMYVDPDGNFGYAVAAGAAFGPAGWGVTLAVTAAWAGYAVYKWHKSKKRKEKNYSYSKSKSKGKNKGKKKIKTKNITKGKRRRVKNYEVNVTRRQLERRLRKGGWKAKKRNGVNEFIRNGRKM
ncbi:hypothetical protein [Listeria aquatica]|uniref:hypothetical protein n=1 Tax=Listeria aquatica TaxID=1494960 RepID=UPI0031F4AF2E